jgi:hypothetical protein
MQVDNVGNSIVIPGVECKNTMFEIKKYVGSVRQDEIAEIVYKWQKLARTRQFRAHKLKDASSENVFRDSCIINLLIRECLVKSKDTYKSVFTQIFVCRDADRNPQSIALTNHLSGPTGCLKIAHLATNPNNIRSPINPKHKSVQGAATAIIVHLAKQCFEKKITWKDKSKHPNIQGIYLESTESAIPFYEKLGFEIFLNIKCEEEFCTPMLLKAEKMQQLVLLKG